MLDRILDFVADKINIISGADYIKFPDGTLICWGKVTFPATSIGIQQVEVNFPVSFIVAPRVVTSWRDSVAVPNYMGAVWAQDQSTTASKLILNAQRKATSYNWYADYIAIGRWKSLGGGYRKDWNFNDFGIPQRFRKAVGLC